MNADRHNVDGIPGETETAAKSPTGSRGRRGVYGARRFVITVSSGGSFLRANSHCSRPYFANHIAVRRAGVPPSPVLTTDEYSGSTCCATHSPVRLHRHR
jgi:hypothetical protein